MQSFQMSQFIQRFMIQRSPNSLTKVNVQKQKLPNNLERELWREADLIGSSLAKGPKKTTSNIRILQIMVSGLSLVLGLGTRTWNPYVHITFYSSILLCHTKLYYAILCYTIPQESHVFITFYYTILLDYILYHTTYYTIPCYEDPDVYVVVPLGRRTLWS